LALRVLGVGPGDEVIASTLTFIGSVTPIVFQGATPVFVDSEGSFWNMDVDLLAKEIEACEKKEKLPKAVIPTELYGQCCDYDGIYEICELYGIK
jgi:dTDP-4-amino-4,6-dideoxygalactose transaminase